MLRARALQRPLNPQSIRWSDEEVRRETERRRVETYVEKPPVTPYTTAAAIVPRPSESGAVR